MSAKKIPIAPIFKDLPTVAQVVAMSTATIERLEREGQFPKRRQLSGQRVGWLVREVQEWAESRPVSPLPAPAAHQPTSANLPSSTTSRRVRGRYTPSSASRIRRSRLRTLCHICGGVIRRPGLTLLNSAIAARASVIPS